jgi:plastocyanin
VLLGTAGVMFALPVAAQAASKVVYMGTPPKYAKTFNETYQSDANDFFPHGTTVHVGDSIKFTPVGFHNVDLLVKGGKGNALIVPDGKKVADSNDAAGTAFWFNGLDELGFNPKLFASSFGKSVSYSGAKTVNSGLPLADKPKPFTVKFTKVGSYTYLCDVHAGMKGTVKVVKKSAHAPSAKAHAKAIADQAARDLKEIKKLSKTAVPTGVVDVGVAGEYGTELFGFLPSDITVPTGTTLKFRLTSGSVETHTATTGPGDPDKAPTSYLGTLAKSFEAPTVDPRAAYPSDTPGTPASLTTTLHGNGFWNSGALDAASASPLPADNSVTFAEAGTYTFYCLIHPFMKGTVKVT